MATITLLFTPLFISLWTFRLSEDKCTRKDDFYTAKDSPLKL